MNVQAVMKSRIVDHLVAACVTGLEFLGYILAAIAVFVSRDLGVRWAGYVSVMLLVLVIPVFNCILPRGRRTDGILVLLRAYEFGLFCLTLTLGGGLLSSSFGMIGPYVLMWYCAVFGCVVLLRNAFYWRTPDTIAPPSVDRGFLGDLIAFLASPSSAVGQACALGLGVAALGMASMYGSANVAHLLSFGEYLAVPVLLATVVKVLGFRQRGLSVALVALYVYVGCVDGLQFDWMREIELFGHDLTACIPLDASGMRRHPIVHEFMGASLLALAAAVLTVCVTIEFGRYRRSVRQGRARLND